MGYTIFEWDKGLLLGMHGRASAELVLGYGMIGPSAHSTQPGDKWPYYTRGGHWPPFHQGTKIAGISHWVYFPTRVTDYNSDTEYILPQPFYRLQFRHWRYSASTL